MAFCAICGGYHDPRTPCAVANRPSGSKGTGESKDAKRLARRVDWILGMVALLAIAFAVFYMAMN